MDKRQALVFGAGKIGRGFLAEIFVDAGYDLTFVEYAPELVKLLRERNQYTIFKAVSGNQIDEVTIKGFSAYQNEDKAPIIQRLMQKDTILGVAVHQAALPAICDLLAPVIEERAALLPQNGFNIILCVNMMHPAKRMRALLEERVKSNVQPYLKNMVGLVESVVMRMSPEASPDMLKKCPLAVLNSGYPEMPVDQKAFRGVIPQTPLMRLSEDIEAEEARKIYTLNMAHATLCYKGMPKGYIWAADCLQDSELAAFLKEALAEAGMGLCAKYGFTPEDMQAWNDKVYQSLENRALGDKLDRLGADSRRKLGPDDRLVGPAKLCLQAGGNPKALTEAIAAGYAFVQDNDPGSAEVYEFVKAQGIEKAVAHFSGLTPEQPLFTAIIKAYHNKK